MDLHLGLALSLIPTQMISSCFDLKPAMVSGNNHGSSSGSSPAADEYYCGNSLKRKRQAFENRNDHLVITPTRTTTTLPLLSWQQNEEEDDDFHDHENHSFTTKKDEEEDVGVVGWPPIKSWKRKKCYREQQRRQNGRRLVVVGGRMIRSSNYVKVKMEGVTIARKIDLSQYNSFASLSTSLISMFGITSDIEYRSNYVLTYQDKDGDWLVAEHDYVPWRSLVESVQRLKLQRC